MKIIVKNNSARTYMFCGRARGTNTIKRIVIKPMANPLGYQEVDSKDWDLVKGQNEVEHAIENGNLIVKNADQTKADYEVVKADVNLLPMAGKKKGFKEVASDVDAAIESGDFDEISKKYPAFAKMIDEKINAAVNASKNADDPGDDDLAENLDALLAGLGDDVSADDTKAALKEYGSKKYGLKFGNSGVPKMIEKIKEAESDGD